MSIPVEYRQISGIPGYRFGDDGSVWGCKDDCGRLTDHWMRLSPWRSKDGARYWGITLSVAGRPVRFRIHNLVLTAFVGPRPAGLWGLHNDGDTSNNRLGNLRWGTPAENANDTACHGRRLFGSKNPQAKIREEDIPEIRRLRDTGMTQEEIGDRYGVRKSTICRLLKGIHWPHVD